MCGCEITTPSRQSSGSRNPRTIGRSPSPPRAPINSHQPPSPPANTPMLSDGSLMILVAFGRGPAGGPGEDQGSAAATRRAESREYRMASNRVEPWCQTRVLRTSCECDGSSSGFPQRDGPVRALQRTRRSARSPRHARGWGTGNRRERPGTADRASGRTTPSASSASSPARWFA